MATPISNNPIQNTGITALINASNSNTPPADNGVNLFGEDGFTFGDLIDIVNPLQHIPVVSNIYRKISGDTIAPAMEIAGGALFGGPLGAAISFVTTAYQSHKNSSENESTDPDSPYMNKQSTTIDPSSVADNMLQPAPNTISSGDYSGNNNSLIDKTDYTKQSFERSNAWVLSSENISYTENTSANINTLQNKHVYQPADGILNIATNAIESYTNVITSNKTPEKSIDITIGSNSDSG